MSEFDARPLNWRFLVPDEPEGLLLLRASEERLSGAVSPDRTSVDLADALAGPIYPAVVAPDLRTWSTLAGAGGSRTLLTRLATKVSPHGWLAIGLANPWYPMDPFTRGALGRRTARRILRSAGFASVRTYLAFPDERCPAYLVRSDGRAELDYLLDRLFLPYVGDAQGVRARIKGRAIRWLRRGALVAPHRLRATLAPAVVLVARRES